tara:strand:- start:146 stop:418 length:273 start_codon:yes stop_codon:yes gene_type:complete
MAVSPSVMPDTGKSPLFRVLIQSCLEKTPNNTSNTVHRNRIAAIRTLSAGNIFRDSHGLRADKRGQRHPEHCAIAQSFIKKGTFFRFNRN